jgi:hypothetical protein
MASFINGYCGIGIWENDLSIWRTRDYTVKVSYSESKGWPETSTTAVIHHT